MADDLTRWVAQQACADLIVMLRHAHAGATIAKLQIFDGSAEALGQEMFAHRARLDVVDQLELMHEEARATIKAEEANNG